MKPTRAMVPALAMLLAACTGVLGGGDPGAGKGKTAGDDMSASTEALPLRRLSKRQYTNTIHDLVAIAIPGEADAVNQAIAPVLARLPDDALVTALNQRRGGFHRLDQNVQQTHADIAYAVANEIGKQLTSTTGRLVAVFGPGIIDGDKDACLTSFLTRVGERVLRRPVTAEDVAFYKSPIVDGDITSDALADVVALLFAAPDVLYVVERTTAPVGTPQKLGPYQLAVRLSYQLLDTLPDEELFALARSGELSKDDVYAKQAARLTADPRAREVFDQLFSEWLRLEELERLDARVGDPVFDAFARDDVPTATLRGSMFADVLDAAAWVTAHGGTLSDLLQNRQSFARTPDLAKIYGVPVWDGAGEPPPFPDPERAGLVARAAFVANGSANTRPIMKGVRIRDGLLCDPIPPPPPNAAATRIDLSATMTTREVVEQLTEGQGSMCATCHAVLINPLGFATEGFDSLGRRRTEQDLFDRFGNLIGEKQVDVRSVPRVVPTDLRTSQGPADLTRYLVESKRVEACFARNLFRFAFERSETTADDAVIAAIAADAEKKPLRDVLASIVLRPEFKSRMIKEAP